MPEKPTVIVIFDNNADPAIRGYFIGDHGTARASYVMDILRTRHPGHQSRGTDGPTFYVGAPGLADVLATLEVCHERAEVVRTAGAVQAPWFSPEQIRTLHRLLGTSGGFLEIETAIRKLGLAVEQQERWLAERDTQLEVLAYPLELLRGVVGASLTDNTGGMVRRAAGLLAGYKVVLERAKEIHGRREFKCADLPSGVLATLDSALQAAEEGVDDLRRELRLADGTSPERVLNHALETVRLYKEISQLTDVLKRDYSIATKKPLGVINAMVGVIDELEAAVKKASIPSGAYSQHIAAMVNPKLRANVRKLVHEVNTVIRALGGKQDCPDIDTDTEVELGSLARALLEWDKRRTGAIDTALTTTQLTMHGYNELEALAKPKF